MRLGKAAFAMGAACLFLIGCQTSSDEFGDRGSSKVQAAKPLTDEQKKTMPPQAVKHVSEMDAYAKAQTQAMAGRR